MLITHCQIPLPLVSTMFYSPKCIYLAKQCSTTYKLCKTVLRHMLNGASYTLSLIDSTKLNEDLVVLIHLYTWEECVAIPELCFNNLLPHIISGVFFSLC
jgi:hypothetical protein